MNASSRNLRRSVLALTAVVALAWGAAAQAHCDTLDGPVVSDARLALDSGEINRALAWVQPAGEAEVRDAFQSAHAVRKQGGGAAELADRYFFETLVRVHRAGEGAPYTGLKPAGEVEKPIATADESLKHGDLDGVAKMIVASVRDGLHQKFDAVMASRERNPADVAAGRAYVKAYVDYVHYVERLHDAAGSAQEATSAHAH